MRTDEKETLSDVPDHIESTPCETGSEGCENELVALLETILVLVETQGDGGCRGVAVLLDVDKYLGGIDAEASAYSLDDAEVGLVRAEPVDIVDIAVGRSSPLPRAKTRACRSQRSCRHCVRPGSHSAGERRLSREMRGEPNHRRASTDARGRRRRYGTHRR